MTTHTAESLAALTDAAFSRVIAELAGFEWRLHGPSIPDYAGDLNAAIELIEDPDIESDVEIERLYPDGERLAWDVRLRLPDFYVTHGSLARALSTAWALWKQAQDQRPDEREG